MNLPNLLFFIFKLILILTVFNLADTATATPTDQQEVTVKSLQGKVKYKGAKNQKWNLVPKDGVKKGFSFTIFSQLYLVNRDARITLRCPSGGEEVTFVFQPQPQDVAPKCPSTSNVLAGIGLWIGGNDPKIPYIITPRYYFVASNRPTIRWNRVDGAAYYTIILKQVDGIRLPYPEWQLETQRQQDQKVSAADARIQEFPYPVNSSIKAGTAYRIEVQAFAQDRKLLASSVEEEKDSDRKIFNFNFDRKVMGVDSFAFKFMPEPNASDKQDCSMQHALTSGQIPLQIALSCAGKKFYAESIEVLLFTLATDSNNPSLYRVLGEIYLKTGLNGLAKIALEKSIELSQSGTESELPYRARARFKLATLYGETGRREEAIKLLEAAKQDYASWSECSLGADSCSSELSDVESYRKDLESRFD
jgi:tetratricopeptide (TPR) repeat protein